MSKFSKTYSKASSPPFGQDKACCKLNESPQTHSVNKLVCIEGKIVSLCF